MQRNLFAAVPPTPTSVISGAGITAVTAVNKDVFAAGFKKSLKNHLPDGVYSGKGKDSALQWQKLSKTLELHCGAYHVAFTECIGPEDKIPAGGLNDKANKLIYACLFAVIG